MRIPPRNPIKVIGMGNVWRGDDAAGLLVARRIKQENPPQAAILEIQGTVGEVREAWKGAAGVIVVDAVSSGGLPGTIYRFDAHAPGTAFPLSRSSSSHGWGLAEALALGQVFQDLPPFLIIYGIEGKNFQLGQDLSPEVAAAIPEATRRIFQEIQVWLSVG
ncbi:MAG: hydrogenase maturation protease [Thermodesulfobacteriota bacterium]